VNQSRPGTCRTLTLEVTGPNAISDRHLNTSKGFNRDLTLTLKDLVNVVLTIAGG